MAYFFHDVRAAVDWIGSSGGEQGALLPAASTTLAWRSRWQKGRGVQIVQTPRGRNAGHSELAAKRRPASVDSTPSCPIPSLCAYLRVSQALNDLTRSQIPAFQLHIQVNNGHFAWKMYYGVHALRLHPVPRKLSQKKTLVYPHAYNDFKTTMRTSACGGRSRAS